MMNKKHKKVGMGQFFLNMFFIILCLCYVLPLILLVSISLDGEKSQYFSLFPKKFSTAAYEALFVNPQQIIDAYAVTIFYSITGVLLSLVLMGTLGYAISRKNFKLRNIFVFMIFFTVLFGGGMVPTYMVNANLLHLNDTIWIYILPVVVNGWSVIVLKTNFQNLPAELFESARMDGASEFRLCFNIAIPLSKPILATTAFLKFLDFWNDWSTAQVYIKENVRLRSLQYLLKMFVDSMQMMENVLNGATGIAADGEMVANLESIRFAMAVVGVGPALLVFPFFQKYFAKGMIVGSVKG